MDIYETFNSVNKDIVEYPYSLLSSEKIIETGSTINLELDEISKEYIEFKKNIADNNKNDELKKYDKKINDSKKVIVVSFTF